MGGASRQCAQAYRPRRSQVAVHRQHEIAVGSEPGCHSQGRWQVNAVTPFAFEDHAVRVVRDDDGDPLFAASDICGVLDLPNVSQALSRLDNDEKREITTDDVTGRQQAIWFVTESGLYHLIFTSRKPEAEQFRKWVTSEVLPTIRKTGRFIAKELTPAEIILAQAQRLVEQERRVRAIEEAQVDQDRRLHDLEIRVQSEPEHFSIIGYCRLCGLPVPSRNEAQSIGQRAVKLSRVMGQSTGKTTDPRYGLVNTYHVSVLDELFAPKGS
jgi:prophage antirepressor-like protein